MLQMREEHFLEKHHKYFSVAELHTETLTFLVEAVFLFVCLFSPHYFYVFQKYFFPFCSS